MNNSTRMFWLLAISQGLCLAFGFWFHGRVVVASADWARGTAQVDQRASGSEQSSPESTTAAAGTAATSDSAVLESMPSASVLMWAWTCGLQSIIAYLILSRTYGEHTRWQIESQEISLQQSGDLVRTRDAVIFGLAKLAEFRDPDTGDHLERIALYSIRLARELKRHPQYSSTITPSFIRLIGISSALHDIGKVGVEDAILLKPGRLNDDERYRMQLHVTVGSECIRQIEHRLGSSNFLQMAREIASFHHERWDGSGYPHGIAGKEIPLAARIVAIADVYDALSSRRVYKPAYPHEECVRIIREEAGRQFDPELVKVFLEIEAEFHEIALRFTNPPPEEEHEDSTAEAAAESPTRDEEQVLMSVVALTDELSAAAQPVSDVGRSPDDPLTAQSRSAEDRAASPPSACETEDPPAAASTAASAESWSGT